MQVFLNGLDNLHECCTVVSRVSYIVFIVVYCNTLHSTELYYTVLCFAVLIISYCTIPGLELENVISLSELAGQPAQVMCCSIYCVLHRFPCTVP